MKRLLVSLLGVLLLGVFAIHHGEARPSRASADDLTVLEFKTMLPVSGPFVRTADPLMRGLTGGGLPWIITRGSGELSPEGELEVHVRGLVLAKAAPVPPALQGTNPVANFQAVVSCVSIGAGGKSTVANVHTDNFPASPQGNADIEAKVSLPAPCFAAVIFVTAPATSPTTTGAWFAVTGH